MGKAVILALAAGFFTAVSSVCQRRGASIAPGGDHFSPRLILFLLRQPIWLAGIASMLLGFAFQVTALHYGSLALVQPILASELLFVFAYIAIVGARRVQRRDWLAGGAMAAGLGVFLYVAAPSGGQRDAPGWTWWVAGLSVLGVALLAALLVFGPARRGRPASPGRRAAILGIATGVCWGFVAAVIKELTSHTAGGVLEILSSWPVYVLVAGGAASMLLASHALQAGPLAASQPGFTIVDPLVASLLGVFLFKDHMQFHAADIVIEALAVGALVWGVVAISRSHLVQDEIREGEPSS